MFEHFGLARRTKGWDCMSRKISRVCHECMHIMIILDRGRSIGLAQPAIVLKIYIRLKVCR
jgi:hypothetical protein